MGPAVYILSTLSCILISALLLRGYLASRRRLLFWSMLCFGILAIANCLLVLDFLIFPNVDLGSYRSVVTLVALVVLLYGLVFESE
ncbi:MAG: DUF5985 family protein [Chthoniobacterales bacterium]